MKNSLAFVSYALAALSGVCFIMGVTILTGGRI